ncbi:MAG: NUDIX domain-containing protein, partial [Bacteroidales bacterium]|nr:NUDIX domain-containing protein [Bacteroidales bacterium]
IIMEKNYTFDELFDMGIKFHHYANTAYPLRVNSLAQYELHDTAAIRRVVEQNIKSQKEINLYVHVPYCKARCKFCEYVVMNDPNEVPQDKYVDYLLREIEMYREMVGDKPVVGYDLGGGTPMYLTVDNIQRITDSIKRFNIKPGVASSIETTPVIAAKEVEKLMATRKMGYERISMGFQTVSASLLESLGREGSKSIYEQAVKNIRLAGYNRLNIDLMYGFLNQTDEDFANTVKYTIAMNPEYVTLYRNRYKGTKLEKESQGVSLFKANRQYEIAYSLLKAAGYMANVGKNTFSRVDGDLGTSDYLTTRVVNATSYIGMGLGAQSFVGNYLAYNLGCDNHKMDKYFAAIDSNILPINDIADMPVEEVRAKALSVMFYFGFISMKSYQKRFGEDFKEVFKGEIKYLQDNMLMEYIDDDTFMLTEYGSHHIYGIIPLFYSQRSKEEMFAMANRILNPEKGESIYLEKYDRKEYDAPSVAADIIVLSRDKQNILLITRGNHPFANCLALPGGFYTPDDDTIENCAVRELNEETSLAIAADDLKLVKVSSGNNRDPRGWIVSVAYLVILDTNISPLADSDAILCKWYPLADLDKLQLAFDHRAIIEAALKMMA